MTDMAQLHARPAVLPHVPRNEHVHIEEEILARPVSPARFVGTWPEYLQHRMHLRPSDLATPMTGTPNSAWA
jgi:hypothetical protein